MGRMTSVPATLRLHPGDNVRVARVPLEPGDPLGENHAPCRDDIPAGHKVATEPIEVGDPIRKYGEIIGFATQRIKPGSHVHTHNTKMGDFKREARIGTKTRSVPRVAEDERAGFEGFLREDGRVGTRNYIGIIPTVSCSAGVARFIRVAFTPDRLSPYGNVDGVVSFVHGSGCAMNPKDEGFDLLQRTLAGYARHPNLAGVLLVGLGCEVNRIDSLFENAGLHRGNRVRAFNIQEAGGTRRSVERGIEIIQEMLQAANRAQRKRVTAQHIVLGLECGGSDAYSGISANPALGAAVDRLIAHGGTAILSETPEIYGAEHLLTSRAETREVGEQLIERIQWWEDYTRRSGAEINNNPTPGNKAGGLTTILEKSLGASVKGGTTHLMAVYGYAEPVLKKGLVFMDTPGYDTVSATGMIAGGANLICFTTGRGSVSGYKPVPTLKLASNTAMYRALEEDMDINCGAIIDGEATVEETGEVIFRRILETASGKRTRSEAFGFGDNEFVPWHLGPVL